MPVCFLTSQYQLFLVFLYWHIGKIRVVVYSTKNKYLFAVNIVYLGLNGKHYLLCYCRKGSIWYSFFINGHTLNLSLKLWHHLSYTSLQRRLKSGSSVGYRFKSSGTCWINGIIVHGVCELSMNFLETPFTCDYII